jgi:ABC-type branched-subunit amino acid transport system substrate-binding protein
MRSVKPFRQLVSVVLAALAMTLIGSQAAGAAAPAASGQVVVQRGDAVQIAVVLPFTGDLEALGEAAWNSVQLAVEKHSRIKGFAVRLNRFNGPCGTDDGLNLTAANQVIANPQNVAVIGHFCSPHFKEALPVYEAAGVVTISGSVTGATVPAFGPDVFNSVAITDPCCPFQDNFGPWYATVSQLPGDQFWRQQVYLREVGTPPPDFADLYYDATSLLLNRLARVASLDEGGSLVIDRAALAQAVRATTGFDGVTCDVALDGTGYRVNDPDSLSKCASIGWQHGGS